MSDISQYPTLTDSQRIQARKNAEHNLLARYGRKPKRSDFQEFSIRKFPLYISLPVLLVLAFIAISAGIISAFRIYYAARDYFLVSIPNQDLADVVGYLTPPAAELLVVISTFSGMIYATGKNRWAFVFPMFIGAAVAFVGNWHMSDPHTTWGWVETLFPPSAVIAVGFYFELVMLPDLERRQKNEAAFKKADAEYNRLISRPDDHPAWLNIYGAALWETWIRIYGGRFEGDAIAPEDRRGLALREMEAEDFFGENFRNFRKSQKGHGSATPHAKRKVLEYLRDHPDALSLKQSEIAEILDVSVPTVSRAVSAYQRNGHETED
jgi:hypothetical protein